MRLVGSGFHVMGTRHKQCVHDDTFNLSSLWLLDGYLDVASLCKLGFSCQFMQSEFQQTRIINVSSKRQGQKI